MISTSFIELDRLAIETNFSFLKDLYGPDVKISSVVKANAYGHGIREYVPLVEEQGINHFAVFSVEEASALLNVKRNTSEIMIMGWISDEDLDWVISNSIEFFVFEFTRLLKALEIAMRKNIPAKIHLEVETGLNRTGLNQSELIKAAEIAELNKDFLCIYGLCTHLAGAESIANDHRVNRQLRKFDRISKIPIIEGLNPRYKHAACSAASIAYPKSRFNLVRVGIMQFGFWSSKETYIQYISKHKNNLNPLKRVISWKSFVMSIKKVKQGEFVSYGTTYLAQEDKIIGIVPVGYASGYKRSLSNQGRVLLKGQRVGVIGLVNMNMLIIDISNVSGVKKGDEVVLIGHQGELSISVNSFTELSQQLNYEVLVSLPSSIPRKII